MPNTPALNIARVTLWLIGINVAIHAIRIVLPAGLDDEIAVMFGFAPSLFIAPGYGVYAPDFAVTWVTPVSYMFLHADVVHLGLNMLFLAAVGSGVERRVGPVRYVAFYLVTGVTALIGTGLMHWFTLNIVILIGASGAISGLFGGIARFYFLPRPGEPPLRRRAGASMVIVFIAVNLIFGALGVDAFGSVRAVAWEAHIGGLVMGFLLFPLFDRKQQQVTAN